jgi:hypothetical protein
MVQFLANNVTAVIGLAGVMVGASLTGAFALFKDWLMRGRDFDLKLWEKFLERRISAHEVVIGLAIKMRFVCGAGVDASGEVERAPQVMISRGDFEGWFTQFTEQSAPVTTWLSTAAKRELNFVQDYLMTLHVNMGKFPDVDFATVGSFVRQDFIDLSSSLEKAAFAFFKTAQKRRLSDLTEHHKYPRQETERRLQNTVLLSRWKELEALIRSGQKWPS